MKIDLCIHLFPKSSLRTTRKLMIISRVMDVKLSPRHVEECVKDSMRLGKAKIRLSLYVVPLKPVLLLIC